MLEAACPIAKHARARPDDVAVVDRGTRYSFAGYDDAICRTMAALPVSAGDRMGLCAPPSYAYLCLLQALVRQGAIAVPLSPRLPAAARAAQVRTLDLQTCFTDPLPSPPAAATDVATDSTVGLDLDAPVLAVLTSGSAAAPKAVVHSFGSLAYNALGANANMPLGPGDRWLLSLPLYHVSGLGILFRTALAGATVVLDDGSDLPAAIRAHGITHVSLVAAQLDALVAAWKAEGPLPTLKGVLAGGSHVPAGLIAAALEVGVPLHTTYGSTEMGSQITTTAASDTPGRRMTSGRLLPYREAVIRADGEILVRGKTLCLGYLVEGAIRSCADPEGWFHSGDTGAFDAEGYLTVTGRKDAMFVSGGENIYPEEIEEALRRLDGVAQAAVVAVPDRRYGARPVAFVRTAGPRPLSCDEMKAALREALPGFKVPDAILDWPADYPDGRFKVDRPFLRDRAMQRLA